MYINSLNGEYYTIIDFNEVDIIQLLTIEALDMMWYRPESTNIDRGGYHIMSNDSIVNNCFII